jgi:hypothetical protein
MSTSRTVLVRLLCYAGVASQAGALVHCSRTGLDAGVARTEAKAGAPPEEAGAGSALPDSTVAPGDAGATDASLSEADSGDAGDGAPERVPPCLVAEASVDPPIAVAWRVTAGGAYGRFAGVAVDPEGNVLAGGGVFGQVQVGDGPGADGGVMVATSPGNLDVLVTKIGPGGRVLWGRAYGDTSFQDLSSLATDPAGDVVFAGPFVGTMNFMGTGPDAGAGPGVLVSPAGGWMDAYVVKLDANGTHVFSRQVSGEMPPRDWYSAAADTDDTGNLALVATADVAQQPPLLFFAKIDSAGNYLWKRILQGDFTGYILNAHGRLAVDRTSGDVVLALSLMGAFAPFDATEGGVASDAGPAIGVTGQATVWLLRLRATDGAVLWSEPVPSPLDAVLGGVSALAVDDASDIFVAGAASAVTDAGVDAGVSQPLAYVDRFDGSGRLLANRRLYGGGTLTINGLAPRGQGRVVVTGGFEGDVSVSSVAGSTRVLAPNDSPDLFLLELDAAGDLQSRAVLSGALTQYGSAVAVDPRTGATMVAGVDGIAIDRWPDRNGGLGPADGFWTSPMFVAKLALDGGGQDAAPEGGPAAPDAQPLSAGAYDDLGSSRVTWGEGIVACVLVAVKQPATLDGIGFVAGAADPDAGVTDLVMGPYDNGWNGAESFPRHLLATTGPVTAGVAADRYEYPVNACVPLAPGYYWVAQALRGTRAIGDDPGGPTDTAFDWVAAPYAQTLSWDAQAPALPLDVPPDVQPAVFEKLNVYILVSPAP